MKRIQLYPFPLKVGFLALAFTCLCTACLEFGAKENYVDTSEMISSQNGDMTGQFIPDPDPPISGNNSLDFVLAENDGAPIIGAEVTVTPFMPSMGHGSTEVPVVEETGDGKYVSTDIVYTMKGEWELTIEVETDSLSDTFILLYNVE